MPLLAELQAVPLPVAVAKAIGLMGMAAIGAFIASRLLSFIERQFASETAGSPSVPVGPAQVIAAAAQAAHRPAAALLPFFTGAYSLTVLAALAEVATMRTDMYMHFGVLQLCSHGAVGALKVRCAPAGGGTSDMPGGSSSTHCACAGRRRAWWDHQRAAQTLVRVMQTVRCLQPCRR